jgi:hypothetical protein
LVPFSQSSWCNRSPSTKRGNLHHLSTQSNDKSSTRQEWITSKRSKNESPQNETTMDQTITDLVVGATVEDLPQAPGLPWCPLQDPAPTTFSAPDQRNLTRSLRIWGRRRHTGFPGHGFKPAAVAAGEDDDVGAGERNRLGREEAK